MISFLSISLAFFLLLLHYHVMYSAEPAMKILSIVSREAGFACLVAFFLSLTVEWVNRRRHAEAEASLVNRVDAKHQERIDALLKSLEGKHEATSKELLKDVFKTVYERNIDAGIFKVVDDHILKKNLLRKGYKCSITVEPLTAEGDVPGPLPLVKLTFQISYLAVNITDQPIQETILKACVDITPEHEERCRFVRASIDGQDYSSGELEPFLRKDIGNAVWILEIPGPIDKRKEVPVYFEYCKVAPNHNSEVICSTVPMDGLEWDVLLRDGSLDVNSMSLHPENEVRVSAPNRKEFSAWRLNHAILPGQGVVVFWHPKRLSAVVRQ
jgi:hypothetical protein